MEAKMRDLKVTEDLTKAAGVLEDMQGKRTGFEDEMSRDMPRSPTAPPSTFGATGPM